MISAASIFGNPFVALIVDYIATHHRPLAVIFVVLPLSFVLRCVFAFFERRQRQMWPRISPKHAIASSPVLLKEHAARVSRVQNAVRKFQNDILDGGVRKKFLCTARASWQNLSTRFADYKEKSDKIYVGDLSHVLEVDTANMTVHIEPLVEVGAITRYLVPQGYMLATTLEIEEATVGGLSMAVGMTTASHKHGLLSETVVQYDIVTGDGELLHVTRESDAALFHCLPWSHGSLGLLVGLTLKIIPVKPHVKVSYTAHSTMAGYAHHVRELSGALDKDAELADFVEATVFTKETAVVMRGDFVDRSDFPKLRVNNVQRWWKPWYYTHIRSVLENPPAGGTFEELIPTMEYIFRHNRPVFWTLRDQLPEKLGNFPLFRLFFGWMCPPRVTFLKLPATKAIKNEMIFGRVYQDIVLPIHTIEKAVNKSEELFDIWPILLYPSRIYDHGAAKQGMFRCPAKKDLVAGTNYAMYYDLGVYGTPFADYTAWYPQPKAPLDYKPVTAMRNMEEYVREVGGAPFLYADTFMTRDEFDGMFDLKLYEQVREQYKANTNFPHLFEKTAGGPRVAVWKAQLEAEQK